MPRKKLSPQLKKPPEMVKELDDIGDTLANLVVDGSPVYLEKAGSPACWLAVAGVLDGNSLTIHQRKSSS